MLAMSGNAPYDGHAPPPQQQQQILPHQLATQPQPQPQSQTASAPVDPTSQASLPQQLASSEPHQGMQMQQQAQHNSQQQRSVKRPRPVKSCTECRKRKLRCDRLCPCSQCQKSNRNCKYAADHESGNYSDGSDVDATDTGRPTKRSFPPAGGLTTNASDTSSAPLIFSTSKNGEGVPLLEELTLRMERLEKQVMVRSPAVTELSAGRVVPATTATIRGVSIKNNAKKTRYFGQASSRVMLNLFDDAKAFLDQHRSINGARELLSSYRALHHTLQDDHLNALAPITIFVDSMMPVAKRMNDMLPKKEVCDRLVASYIDTSETIYRILHIPDFMEQYDLFWEGKLQSDTFLPQLLAVLSTASRFETKSKGLGNDRQEGVHIPTACALVRIWLDALKGKQLVEFSALQTEVLQLHAQRMITPRYQDLWSQLGFIVRRAMTMGLHRDPDECGPQMTVFQGEIRRRLWYTIMDMDVHISIAVNMPCLVRDGDFSCRPPSNLDDAELFEGMRDLPLSKPIDQHTDNQMQVYAAMTLGARLKVGHLVNRIDTIRDYQEVLDVGAKLDRFLEDINYIFPRQGIQDETQKSKMWRSRVILDMHVRRPLVALYRSLAMGTPDAPPQIVRTYLRSCMVILKYLDEIDPRLPHFQSVANMYHQMLKSDIIQAALSVCYYIQSTVRPGSDNMLSGQQAFRLSPESADDFPTYTADNLILWSPARLIYTVEKSVDLLINHVSGSDCKDILIIVLVLEGVRKQEPRGEEIIHGLYSALEGLLRASNLTREKIHSAPPTGQNAFHADGYMRSHLTQGNKVAASANDFGGWIVWDGWN